MKKLSVALLAMLLIASLFTSCDNNSKAPIDELVEVKIGTQDNGRGLIESSELETIGDPSLKWFYSATKTSQTEFITGQTSGSPITLGDVKTFSQGKWSFVLWAEKCVRNSEGVYVSTGNKVYQGTITDVLITKSSSPVPVIITVSPYIEGQDGFLVFNGVKIKAKASTATTEVTVVPNKVVIDETYSYDLDSNGSHGQIRLTNGSHVVLVSYVGDDGVVYASETKPITIYSNRTTTLSGMIDEETATAEITVVGTAATVKQEGVESKQEGENYFNKASLTISAPVTPAKAVDTESGVTVMTTDVTFDEGSFNVACATYKTELRVDTTSIEDSNFDISGIDETSGLTSVAGLDIILKVDNIDVTTFNDGKSATVTTYIAKNLRSVGVRYKDPTTNVITAYTIDTVNSEPATITGDGYYIASSGKLVFKTTHFSEYYVVADACAYIKESNKAYSSISAAISEANDGNRKTLVLLKDVAESIDVPRGADIILELNGKKISTNTYAIRNNGQLILKDYSDDVSVESTSSVAIVVGSNSFTTVESGTYKGREGALITGLATGATININGGTFTATDNAVIAGNGSNRTGDANTINITGGTFNGGITTPGYVACGIYAPWKDVINVSGGTFNITGGAGIVARAGNVNVSGGTFNCTGNTTGKVGDSRVVVPCSALVFDSEANYPAMADNSKITVTGGTFTSVADSITTVSINSHDDILEIKGGEFSSNPVSYVAEGHVSWFDSNSNTFKVIEAERCVEITSPTELLELGTLLGSSESIYIDIKNNIDMIGETWTPINPASHSKIVINGNNHTISNLTITPDNQHAGLFGSIWVNDSIVIKDLTLDKANIRSDIKDEAADKAVGGFFGKVEATDYVVLDNCHITNSTIIGGHWTGGFIGYAAGYNDINNGAVYMVNAITKCSIADSIVTCKGSAGGFYGHATGNLWTLDKIDNPSVIGCQITSTGTANNKAGCVIGTIGTGRIQVTNYVSDSIKNNTVTSNGTTISEIYGRQGNDPGWLKVNGEDIVRHKDSSWTWEKAGTNGYQPE